MLKEIWERHIKDNDADMRLQPWTKQIHQDRAYLLGLVEEFEDFLQGYKVLIDNHLTPDWLDKKYATLLKKLESEGRE